MVSVDYSSDNGTTFTTYYYLRNGQGDVVKLIDGSGNTVVQYSYDTWGKLIATTGSLATSLGQDQPFRYRGYVYDSETGWYYLQSRYYNPTLCRFISADVLLSTGQGVLGNNAFAYCGNNPIVRSDPSGNSWWDDLCNWVEGAAEDVVEWVEEAVDDVETFVVDTVEDVSNAVDSAVDWTTQAATDARDWIAQAATDTWNWTAQAATNTWNWTTQAATDTWNWAKANWKKCVDWGTAIGGCVITIIGILVAVGVISIPVVGQVVLGVVALGFAAWGIGRLADVW